jgi:hypothetical protein
VKRTQRVHWMQRFMLRSTFGPSGMRSRPWVGALVLEAEARERLAVLERVVLEAALARLVADRAVERVVDEQELHHRALRFGGLGDSVRTTMPSLHHLRRAGGLQLGHALDLDQAHPALADHREARVVAVVGDLDADPARPRRGSCRAGTSTVRSSMVTVGIRRRLPASCRKIPAGISGIGQRPCRTWRGSRRRTSRPGT